jgi:UDP-galactopyranose mutase
MNEMTRRLFNENGIREYVFWYYTPMALSFTRDFVPVASVYDCMDELSAFKGADSRLQDFEKELFQRVDLVFTGGQTLYEAKRSQHRAVHALPSSIDVTHFGKARILKTDPEDQVNIPHPRLGFFGVIDERFDIELLNSLASKQPDWHFIMIGPVVKINPDSLPKHPNIHYLGPKKYDVLPDYLAGWDLALLLFARNESTRFISPTKTPEYLAAGKPVISTSIRDVVRPYGELDLVHIADTASDVVRAAEMVLADSHASDQWLARVDEFLADMSWDKTWGEMSRLLRQIVEAQPKSSARRPTVLPDRSRAATVTSV